jgi:hypothetical protein
LLLLLLLLRLLPVLRLLPDLLLLLPLARPDEDRPDEERLLCALAPLRLFEAVDDRLFELLVLDRALPAFVWAMSRPPCSFLGTREPPGLMP